jgi:hypothetical protein
MLQQWLGTIRVIWPECPAKLSADGKFLSINHSAAVLPLEGANGR